MVRRWWNVSPSRNVVFIILIIVMVALHLTYHVCVVVRCWCIAFDMSLLFQLPFCVPFDVAALVDRFAFVVVDCALEFDVVICFGVEL